MTDVSKLSAGAFMMSARRGYERQRHKARLSQCTRIEVVIEPDEAHGGQIGWCVVFVCGDRRVIANTVERLKEATDIKADYDRFFRGGV